VRSKDWRFIHYADGSEELYDMRADPNEWDNLADGPGYAEVMDKHRRWLPKPDVTPAANSNKRVLTYDKATDEAVWEGQTVRRTDEIPQ
jgi:hypothetical protein